MARIDDLVTQVTDKTLRQNSDVRMNQAIQVDLFASALDHLGAEGEVTNEVLEVDLDRDGHKLYRRYSLPKTAE